MSSKIELKPLLSKHHLSSEHTIIANNHQNYRSYEDQIEENLRMILKRYPHLDHHKVRNLLEELQNNKELAIKILEEQEQTCNKILEEKKGDIKKMLNLSQDQENVILKRSFLNVYKQMIALKKENEQLVKKYDKLGGEYQKVKMMNKLLLEREYNQNRFEQEIRDIC